MKRKSFISWQTMALRDTLQFSNGSYLSLSERETGTETERGTKRGREGERMTSKQLQSGEA